MKDGLGTNKKIVARYGQQRRRGRRVRENLPDGGLEDATWGKVQARSSGLVLPYVGVACLGAILFGYHLGVVNGALEYLAKNLGIAENSIPISIIILHNCYKDLGIAWMLFW